MHSREKARSRKIFAAHITFWLAYTTLNYFINVVQSFRVHVYYIDSVAKYSVAAFTFYGTTFVLLPRFFKPGKYWLLGCSIVAMYFIGHVIKVVLYYKLLVLTGFPKSTYTTSEFFFLNIWWWSQYTLFAFGYWFAMDAIKKTKSASKEPGRQTEI
ncbi:MAG: hypothetical protein EOO01_17935 [Chitinophagaceae bacterium]|nr:MAG: hypothetical protein EOO01_17935 [Chitinophagaceae bacterium]